MENEPSRSVPEAEQSDIHRDSEKRDYGKLHRQKRKRKLLAENRNMSHDSILTQSSLLDFDENKHNGKIDADAFYDTLDIFSDYKGSQLSLADTKIHLKDDDIVISINELFTAKETDITNYSENDAKANNAPGQEKLLMKRKQFSSKRRMRRKEKRWKSDTEVMFRDVELAGRTDIQYDNLSVLDHYTSSDLVNIDVGKSRRITSSEKKVRVPISLCLLLIFLYIIGGAFLFAQWEDWDLLTGSYFCFVTLSTIGFGDIVPGTQLDAWESQEKLVACAMYLAMGLSVLAMCFNLMQEEVKEKCRWLARKIGIMNELG